MIEKCWFVGVRRPLSSRDGRRRTTDSGGGKRKGKAGTLSRAFPTVVAALSHLLRHLRTKTSCVMTLNVQSPILQTRWRAFSLLLLFRMADNSWQHGYGGPEAVDNGLQRLLVTLLIHVEPKRRTYNGILQAPSTLPSSVA